MRENIQKDPLTLRTRLTVCCKQTRFTWWLTVVLMSLSNVNRAPFSLVKVTDAATIKMTPW